MLIDVHAHLDMYSAELDQALAQIEAQQIFTLAVSVDIAAYERGKAIAQRCPYVVPTFGIHPWEAHRFSHDLAALDLYMQETPLFGEIGLDYYFVKEPERQAQQHIVFDYFLAAAASQKKIVNLHTLKAEQAVVEKLEGFHIPRAIVHWYSGPLKLIERYLAAGAYFSIGVELLFSDHIAQVLAAVPDDRLLTETDNPGAYSLFTQQKGMPIALQEVISKIAHLRAMPAADVMTLVARNFTTLIASAEPVAQRWANVLP